MFRIKLAKNFEKFHKIAYNLNHLDFLSLNKKSIMFILKTFKILIF